MYIQKPDFFLFIFFLFLKLFLTLNLSLGDHILRSALLSPPWVLSYLLTLPRIRLKAVTPDHPVLLYGRSPWMEMEWLGRETVREYLLSEDAFEFNAAVAASNPYIRKSTSGSMECVGVFFSFSFYVRIFTLSRRNRGPPHPQWKGMLIHI